MRCFRVRKKARGKRNFHLLMKYARVNEQELRIDTSDPLAEGGSW